MKTVSRLKIMAAAVVMGMLCSACVVHRDRPRPPRPKKHHKHKKPPHRRLHHPHASADMPQQGATLCPDVWYAAV